MTTFNTRNTKKFRKKLKQKSNYPNYRGGKLFGACGSNFLTPTKVRSKADTNTNKIVFMFDRMVKGEDLLSLNRTIINQRGSLDEDKIREYLRRMTTQPKRISNFINSLNNVCLGDSKYFMGRTTASRMVQSQISFGYLFGILNRFGNQYEDYYNGILGLISQLKINLNPIEKGLYPLIRVMGEKEYKQLQREGVYGTRWSCDILQSVLYTIPRLLCNPSEKVYWVCGLFNESDIIYDPIQSSDKPDEFDRFGNENDSLDRNTIYLRKNSFPIETGVFYEYDRSDLMSEFDEKIWKTKLNINPSTSYTSIVYQLWEKLGKKNKDLFLMSEVDESTPQGLKLPERFNQVTLREYSDLIEKWYVKYDGKLNKRLIGSLVERIVPNEVISLVA